jgi:hypothetical protein
MRRWPTAMPTTVVESIGQTAPHATCLHEDHTAIKPHPILVYMENPYQDRE